MYNVIMLGVIFLFLFTAFQTSTVVEPTVLQQIYGKEKGNTIGFNSVAIIYAVFTFANWLAPSVVSVLGAKWTLFLCGIPYCLFLGAIIHPFTYTVYIGAALLGLAAGPLWTAQGLYLTQNSNKDTIGRNSGIFWALLESSLVIGNLFVYLYLPADIATITDQERHVIYGTFTSLGVLGVIGVVLLGRPTSFRRGDGSYSLNLSQEHTTPVARDYGLTALKDAFHLVQTKEMMLVSLASFYTGISLTFFSSVYDTAVGNIEATPKFGPHFTKRDVALAGLLVGLGEITGGLLFGLLGKRVVRSGRDPVIVLGLVTHIVFVGVTFLNLPSNSPYEVTVDLSRTPYILPLGPSVYVAMISAYLLGFGDSCFNTQIYSFLGDTYETNSAPAFALYKFFQSLAASISFFYSPYLDIQYQLLIMVVFAVIGSAGFINVEWSTQRRGGYLAIK
ncbi:UNC93-like protein MFSD11 [Corticium candelabrum]|uniref:UNC93-like protein MFSD11 n=1 Tax=Corticium candelabrum TaxID=121492 RepID=UPI002E31041F|nr:UNC93-like protein MFSD11 [Corticium candelabrum]